MSFNSLFGLGTHSPDANLEGWWPLQETSGTQADDYSGNARHGTINGMGSNPVTATGPNSWLTSAFDFDGVDDAVALPNTALITSWNPRTYGFWIKPNTQVMRDFFSAGNGDGPASRFGLRASGSSVADLKHCTITSTANPAYPSATWSSAAVVAKQPTTPFIEYYRDGSLLPGLSMSSDRTIATGGALNLWLGFDSNNGSFVSVEAVNLFSFSRALLAAEIGEINSGPEPVNTAAPTVSGSTTQGSTLTVSVGTWGLDSPFNGGTNGTITYSYQWTRDGSDISGATSSTYTTQVADVGAAIRCRVRASNTGGFDSSADTVSSNSITVVSSGGSNIAAIANYYRRMRAG